MTIQLNERICVVPELSGVGGMVSFREKLVVGLNARGIEVCQGLADRPYGAVLVVGGSRRLGKLWRARREGVRIVQRLDGMNWLHHRLRTGARHYLRAEYGNLLLRLIRARLADRIVYQSQFACRWWEQAHGAVRKPYRVIYNGVDLAIYTPEGPQTPPPDRVRLLLVEGSLMGGYELGLEHAIRLAAGLASSARVSHSHSRLVELMIVGRVRKDIRQCWDTWAIENGYRTMRITWAGSIPHQNIPEIDRSAHLLFSADLNAACPNSVIEALACGTPVVSFDTGALPELVPPKAGRIALYGGDPWKLDPPDMDALVKAGEEVLWGGEQLRSGARAQAEAYFDLEDMVDDYQQVLLGD